ncbi:hypothetical protein BJY52DRAFT_1228981 [Lactarius psammicola]|nr:hypothetical protein BJY52DRAFT_1228981 [Lactarius psammicola]
MLAPPVDLSKMVMEGTKGTDNYGLGYSTVQKDKLVMIAHDLQDEIGWDVSKGASGISEFYLCDMIRLHRNTAIPASTTDFNDSVGMVLAGLDARIDDKLPVKGVTPSSWFYLSATLLASMVQGVLHSRGPKRVTQKHIQRVVKLAAVTEYQANVLDVMNLKEITLEEMVAQVTDHLHNDPSTQEQVEKVVQDQIVRECSEEIQAQVDKKVEEIKASIVSEEVEKYLLLQETESAKAIIQCKYLENIKEASKALGYMLVQIDNDKECKGHSHKQEALKARAKQKKGGRGLIIPKPFSTAGSEALDDGMEEDPIPPPVFNVESSPAPVLPISVPPNV